MAALPLGATPRPPHDLPLPGPKNDLKPTPGRTPVPRRTVVPKPAQKGLSAARPVSQTPAQAATAAVSRLLAPQYTQAQAEAKRQNDAINAYTQNVMAQLKGLPDQVQGDYNNAIGAQSQMVNAAADSLRGANPFSQDQQLLQAIGAPQSQIDQVGSNLANTFNGGAAVGQFVNGVSPLGALRSQGLTATEMARMQPGFEALAGRQSLASALAQQSDARAKIAAQQPGLVDSWLSQFSSGKAKQQQLAMEAQALGLKTQNQNFSQGLSLAKYKAQQSKYISDYNLQVRKFNAQQTTTATKLKLPSSSLSRANGYLTAADGSAILDPSGKRQILPGFNTNAKGQVVKVGGAGGTKTASVSQVNSFLKSLTTQTYASVTKKNPKTNTSVNYKQPTGKTYTMKFGEAYKRLTAMGVSDQKARQYLQTIYPRGVAGRASLTNEEQSALGRANQPTVTGVIDIKKLGERHYITLAQVKALRKVKRLPKGFWYTADQGHTVYVIKPGY